MKERPILFSAPMVRAILAGSKTQTRRVVKSTPPHGVLGASWCDEDQWHWRTEAGHLRSAENHFRQYCAPGDRLWVRETWRCASRGYGRDGIEYRADESFRANDGTREQAEEWACDDSRTPGEWRPSIFHRRWASRLTLDVVAVRVERLQAITEADAVAEGLENHGGGELADAWWPEHDGLAQAGATPREGFRVLWEAINGPGSWAANPWVWVVSFRKLA